MTDLALREAERSYAAEQSPEAWQNLSVARQRAGQPYIAKLRLQIHPNLLWNEKLRHNAIVALYWDDPDGVPNSGDEWGSNGAVSVRDTGGEEVLLRDREIDTRTIDLDVVLDQPCFERDGSAKLIVVSLGSHLAEYWRREVEIYNSHQEVNIVVGPPSPLPNRYY